MESVEWRGHRLLSIGENEFELKHDTGGTRVELHVHRSNVTSRWMARIYIDDDCHSMEYGGTPEEALDLVLQLELARIERIRLAAESI